MRTTANTMAAQLRGLAGVGGVTVRPLDRYAGFGAFDVVRATPGSAECFRAAARASFVARVEAGDSVTD